MGRGIRGGLPLPLGGGEGRGEGAGRPKDLLQISKIRQDAGSRAQRCRGMIVKASRVESFGVRWQSEAATALWLGDPQSKAASRCACRRTPYLPADGCRLTAPAPEGQMKVAGGKRGCERGPRFGRSRTGRPGGAHGGGMKIASVALHFLRPPGRCTAEPSRPRRLSQTNKRSRRREEADGPWGHLVRLLTPTATNCCLLKLVVRIGGQLF